MVGTEDLCHLQLNNYIYLALIVKYGTATGNICTRTLIIVYA